MSMQQLSIQAQLAQASYAELSAGMPTNNLEAALRSPGRDFTETQAQQFAAKYSVVLQYNDDASILVGNGTGLSLTVFRDTATNQLTLAIRGTEGELFTSPDWTTGNNSIVVGGAAYPQIAALYNWWLRATAAPSTLVPQYEVVTGAADNPSALALTGGDHYLVRKDDAAATGELRGALVADPDQHLEVTGYSLGGHLATAFTLLYPAAVRTTYTFNGAGVGEVASGNLAQALDMFRGLRGSDQLGSPEAANASDFRSAA